MHETKPHPKSLQLVNLQKSPLSPKSVLFWRHTTGISISLLAQNPQRYENAIVFLGLWVGSLTIVFTVAGIASGLIYLFFTEHTKNKAWRNFILAAWVVAIFLLFGQWLLPKADMQSAPTTSLSPTPRKTPSNTINSYAGSKHYFNADGQQLVDFNVEGALKAGHSKREIAEYLVNSKGWDISEAYKRGYSDSEIIEKLTPNNTSTQKTAP